MGALATVKYKGEYLCCLCMCLCVISYSTMGYLKENTEQFHASSKSATPFFKQATEIPVPSLLFSNS